LLLVFLGLVSKDYLAHRSVERSLEKVNQSLKATVVPEQMKYSACGRADEKFGKGAKNCRIAISDRFEAISPDKAVKIMSTYQQAIEQTEDFKVVRPVRLPYINSGPSEFSPGANGQYIHEQTDKLCNLTYDFTDKSSRISFSCDDDYLYNHL
jgi:hypothetical protein